ncbi:MAG TPA: alpha/beta fold hydrolase [Gemmataceae bacterium]|nr:alpha/beta fold hydrolase [Gemmataceae bacterium]
MRPLTYASVALAIGLLLSWAPASYAQKAAKGKDVTFETADGVRLSGTFYASSSPKVNASEAPAVLLLHELEGNSNEAGWEELATELSKRGFAVLAFDFRGHGNSTTISDLNAFWSKVENRQSIPGFIGSLPPASQKKDTISFKDFKGRTQYYPVLVNDILAARMYLDKQNDAGQCNSANIFIIGAKDGATLGAMWAVSEQYRYPARRQFPGGPLQREQTAEGKNIAGCIWLSANGYVGSRRMSTSSHLRVLGKDKKIPMVFVYGEKDLAAKQFADSAKQSAMGDDAITKKFTVALPVKGGTEKLRGRLLLGKGLDTTEKIGNYLTNLSERLKAREAPTVKKDPDNSEFCWQMGLSRPIPFKQLVGPINNQVQVRILTPLDALGLTR